MIVKKVVAGAFVGAAVVAAGACRSPTQVTFVIDTDLPCDRLQGVAIVVASDARDAMTRADLAAYTTKTIRCESTSRVGTLVVVPGGDTGAITVIAGLRQPVEGCKVSEGYKGCIAARRTFAFVEHVPLTIPIVLRESCVDVPCDVETTCARGQCVSSAVSCDEDGTCSDPETLSAGPRDGGADATTADAPPADAPSDAPADAPYDGGVAACVTSCGGVTCQPSSVCCQTFNDRTCQPSVTACQQHGAGSYVELCCTTAAECPVGQVCCLDMLAPGQKAQCATSCPKPKLTICKDMGSAAVDCRIDGGALPVCTFQGGGLYTCP